MSSALYYDPNSTPVQGRVTLFLKSVDLPPVEPNTLSNPDLSAVVDFPNFLDWKVVDGSVVPLTNRDRYLIESASHIRIKKLIVDRWVGEVSTSEKMIVSQLWKYVAGTIALHSENDTVVDDFRVDRGSSQYIRIDGIQVKLSISTTGNFTVKKMNRLGDIQAVINYKAI